MLHHFNDFAFIYNKQTGVVATIYADDKSSTVEVNNDHHYHAAFLHIEPKEVNLLHELTHHLLAIHSGEKTCPIIYASAHNLPMPQDAELMEWKITALSYFSLQQSFRPEHEHEWKALYEVAKIADPYIIRKDIYSIYSKLIA